MNGILHGDVTQHRPDTERPMSQRDSCRPDTERPMSHLDSSTHSVGRACPCAQTLCSQVVRPTLATTLDECLSLLRVLKAVVAAVAARQPWYVRCGGSHGLFGGYRPASRPRRRPICGERSRRQLVPHAGFRQIRYLCCRFTL